MSEYESDSLAIQLNKQVELLSALNIVLEKELQLISSRNAEALM